MFNWVSVNDVTTLNTFLDRVKGFHDAVLRQVIIQHPAFVDKHGRMFNDLDHPGAILVFQSQDREVIGAVVELSKVSSFSIAFDRDLSFEADCDDDKIVLYPHGFAEKEYYKIAVAQMRYKMLDLDSRGPKVNDEMMRVLQDRVQGRMLENDESS